MSPASARNLLLGKSASSEQRDLNPQWIVPDLGSLASNNVVRMLRTSGSPSLWVRLRRSNVSAVAAAFLESSHRGSISAAARCGTLELANTCSQCSWNASQFHDV